MSSARPFIKTGVGAVVLRGPEVLLIRRGKPPFEGRWSIPGGGLEFGESVREAARREVREETGCEIEILGLLDVFEGLPRDHGDPNAHYVMIDFAARWTAGAPRPGDDALEAKFVSFAEAEARLDWDKTREALARTREMAARLGADVV